VLSGSDADRREETRANYFAAALLMPRAQIAGRLVIMGAAVAVSLIAAILLLRWEVRPRPAAAVPGPDAVRATPESA